MFLYICTQVKQINYKIMKATIKELRKAMFDIDFSLIVNENALTNSEGRRFLYEIKSQDAEVDFYIGSAGTFVIETKIIN